jgi:hypothetical protein
MSFYDYSMDQYKTEIGEDWQESDLQDWRDRDVVLVKREGVVDWMQLQSQAANQLQQH